MHLHLDILYRWKISWGAILTDRLVFKVLAVLFHGQLSPALLEAYAVVSFCGFNFLADWQLTANIGPE